MEKLLRSSATAVNTEPESERHLWTVNFISSLSPTFLIVSILGEYMWEANGAIAKQVYEIVENTSTPHSSSMDYQCYSEIPMSFIQPSPT